MLKLIAAILVISGTSGIGISICKEQRERIKHLKAMKHIMSMMQNEIQYGKTSFPEICKNIESRVEEPYDRFFEKLNQEFIKKEGKSFSKLWTESADKLDTISCLTKKDKELFLCFPSKNGYENGEMQEREMEGKIAEIQTSIEKSEKSIETNAKVYLCVGVMSGLLCSLLFW